VDIMFLLERLESLVATGTGVPTTRKVLVDKDAVLELIDQLRVAVPEEIHAAKRINAEGERIIEKANEEGSRIVARAQEQATYLIGERGLTETAQAEGRRIVAEANEAADGVRFGADAYAAQILESLEAEVRKALSGIEKGIDVLEERQAELRGEVAAPVAVPIVPDDEARDVGEWPTAGDRAPAFEEEDAGQTVPR
jgi:cell division septum initiation protein DivIVA